VGGVITMVRRLVQARPVGDNGVLARGGYMELAYDPACPYEVRLAETGPGASEIVFARDLLLAALDGTPAGEGRVRARLRRFRSARHSMLDLVVPGADGGLLEFAICDDSVADFVRDTTDLVPAGDEWRYTEIPDTADALLGEAA
jgi:Streptomyces sporulation and cell division protein, SsgA